jgi:hypothetical protein
MGSRYRQLKITVDAELASSFKAACAAAGASMAGKLSQFMAESSGAAREGRPAPAPDYSTRRKRRAALRRIVSELEQIKAAEERLIDNAPENLRDAPMYEVADHYVSVLDDVIGQLEDMVP